MKARAFAFICGLCLALASCGPKFLEKQGGGGGSAPLLTPCLAPKATSQTFEFRNFRAFPATSAGMAGMGVTGCLVSDLPGTVQEVSITFTGFNAEGVAVGESERRNMYTPTRTFGQWSATSPRWTVPVGATLYPASSNPNPNVESIRVDVAWTGVGNTPRMETYWFAGWHLLPNGQPIPAGSTLDDKEDDPTICALSDDQAQFAVRNATRATVMDNNRPLIYISADVSTKLNQDMGNVDVSFTAFDRRGNFIGSDQSPFNNSNTPLPTYHRVGKGVGLFTRNFADVSGRVLITLRWTAQNGCRWTENHFIDAVPS